MNQVLEMTAQMLAREFLFGDMGMLHNQQFLGAYNESERAV